MKRAAQLLVGSMIGGLVILWALWGDVIFAAFD